MSDPIESKTFRKLEKERSKVGQEEENLESRDVNSSFNENSETDVLVFISLHGLEAVFTNTGRSKSFSESRTIC
jgi:hypothetical protein